MRKLLIAAMLTTIMSVATQANEIISVSSILIQPSPVSLNVQVEKTTTGIQINIWIPTENRIENILN